MNSRNLVEEWLVSKGYTEVKQRSGKSGSYWIYPRFDDSTAYMIVNKKWHPKKFWVHNQRILCNPRGTLAWPALLKYELELNMSDPECFDELEKWLDEVE